MVFDGPGDFEAGILGESQEFEQMLRGFHHRLVRGLSLHVKGDAEFHEPPPGIGVGPGERFASVQTSVAARNHSARAE
jgi:hypothetical protein